jgi:hypothetical protein
LKRFFSPSLIVALFLLAYVGVILGRGEGDPLTFARLGDGFRNGRPVGREGYDGQFAYFIAIDPRPASAAEHLDIPAYRYQRLLYPLLARLLALGQPALIPWTLVLINLVAQVVGTYLVETWLVGHRLSRWYALIYGLWIGLVSAVRVDLSEPLCYALVAGALLAHFQGRRWLAALCLALAVLAKETALLFAAAFILAAMVDVHMPASTPLRSRLGPWALALAPWILALVPLALLELLLYRWFGTWGLASGGYMATPFEIIPYMGLWRIGFSNAFATASVLLFSLLVILPSLWGTMAGTKALLAKNFAPVTWALTINAGFLPFTPFSTFREAGGILRLATGLVLAVILYCGQTRSKKMLNYALVWLAGLAFIFNEIP